MKPYTIGFIGLGLIGGSIAKAIRRVHPDFRIIACDQSRSNLIAALSDGTLNETHDTLSEAFGSCDIIFLCAPVSINIEYLTLLKPIISENCIVTDVGSVKTTIHQASESIGMSHCFIGGHPMAGSEKTGFQNASDRLIENVYYLLTPSQNVAKEKYDQLRALILSISAIPVTLDYREHDRITAAISHLPHIIAYALVNLVRLADNSDQIMRRLAAGGFKDITRIASSSPIMWQQICEENAPQIQNILHTYIDSLKEISEAIDAHDDAFLLEHFSLARDYRNDIPASRTKSVLSSINEIYVDIIDESGAIATIATILATNGISIKNIGIVHNREFQEGALRIEFYENEAMLKAIDLLRRFHYVVHERN